MGKSRDQLVREFLERLAGSDGAERQLPALARARARGWRFDRAEIHERSQLPR